MPDVKRPMRPACRLERQSVVQLRAAAAAVAVLCNGQGEAGLTRISIVYTLE